ncbi:helix-turn-helix domain-containing protein [Streptomyces sp. NBC_01474]|uniref:helix-turn-helix domain-containing protein n=1 Tax=unclassified Streptomyces TaxID=2593676 RepID=UPI002DD8E338|nr:MULTISPECIES: helix-turn-helix transcriptional regulator [unclassified Streptomyces]WSD96847.1 helix-turn-helix domain-containing protein [Streptomyces sp. NBC_01474]
MAEADGTAEFATLLRGLKERSGLSYGVLAKRLHMSTSTLHRYCNGDAVPVDYAPVERLARLCKAGSEELVELHRLWVLADAARRTKPVAAAEEPPAVAPAPVPDAEPVPAPGKRRARRTVLLAAAVAVVVAGGAGAFAVHLAGGGSGDGGGRKDRAGATSSVTQGARSADPSGTASPSPGHKHKPSAGPSRSDAPAGAAPGTPSAPAAGEGTGTPLTVATTPYVYEDPCSQHFLIDRPPAEVPPPPLEQDAPNWVGAIGAVASGEQFIKLTVQGTGSDTVVLQDLDVRVMKSGAPLAWNDYSMGVGCGGGVGTKSFGVDLDAPRPVSVPRNGQRDFPYKVSESDPEVFYIKANTKAHDVSWVLELKWSSGTRHGVLKVDDQGRAFRTSADVGRPGYDYPIGAGSWGERAA